MEIYKQKSQILAYDTVFDYMEEWKEGKDKTSHGESGQKVCSALFYTLWWSWAALHDADMQRVLSHPGFSLFCEEISVGTRELTLVSCTGGCFRILDLQLFKSYLAIPTYQSAEVDNIQEIVHLRFQLRLKLHAIGPFIFLKTLLRCLGHSLLLHSFFTCTHFTFTATSPFPINSFQAFKYSFLASTHCVISPFSNYQVFLLC